MLVAVVAMRGAPFAVPGPEVGALDRAAGAHALLDRIVDQLVIGVAIAGRRLGIIAAAVARIAEFLDHQRLAEPAGETGVLLDILPYLRQPRLIGAGKVARVDPAPVQGPDMRGRIVDLGKAVRLEVDVGALDRALQPLAAGGDEMVRVDRLDEARSAAHPVVESGEQLRGGFGIAAGTRLIGELPSHDGRIVAIGCAGHAVGSADDGANPVVIERHRLGVGVELRGRVREGRPGMGRVVHVDIFAGDVPEIGHHPARPFPEVGQVEHGLHAPLAHFGKAIVEPVEQHRVPRVALAPETGLDRVLERPLLRRSKHAQVCDAELQQRIQLAAEPVAISERSIRAKPGAVPHVRASEAIRPAVEQEARARTLDKSAPRRRGDGRNRQCASKRCAGLQHLASARHCSAPAFCGYSLNPTLRLARGESASDEATG